MSPEVAFENLITLLNNISFVPFAAGLVLVLVQFGKAIFGWDGGRAVLMALVIQVVVWVAYVIAHSRGLDAQFQTTTDTATTILNALFSALFPALLSNGLTQYTYRKLTASNVPGFRKDT